ncbi:Hypothetical_protein [Hexamita inflata]|uniref:Hypothetical_protein n=1 Tax=Hexamita inflata TaxID=28002 RepID=A0ABP1HHJ0_9EUKA
MRVIVSSELSFEISCPLHFTPCLLRTRQSLLFICRPWSDVLEITEHLWSNFAVPLETGNGAGLSRRWMVQESGPERLFDGHCFKLFYVCHLFIYVVIENYFIYCH